MKKEIKYHNDDVSAIQLAQKIAKIADDKKSSDTKILQLDGISSLTDYMLVTSGSNERHLKAIADDIEKTIKEEYGVFCRHIEKPDTANWIVLDYLDVIVHIFLPDAREFYGLERIWGDAKNIDLEIADIKSEN